MGQKHFYIPYKIWNMFKYLALSMLFFGFQYFWIFQYSLSIKLVVNSAMVVGFILFAYANEKAQLQVKSQE
jgi:hypothetical protein